MSIWAAAVAASLALGSAPVDPRAPQGPTSVTYEGAADVPTPAASPEPEPSPPSGKRAKRSRKSKRPGGKGRVPPPTVRGVKERLAVAVGLSPEAPGSKAEKALLDRLERTARASKNPTVHLRRLRAGAGDARRICRERRDDLVIMIGYLPNRDDPVLLAHDCRLDHALGVRAAAAASEPQLIGTLWREHRDLMRQGVKERRRFTKLGPRARAGIIAGVAIVVLGAAVGILVANALREEKVVLKVAP